MAPQRRLTVLVVTHYYSAHRGGIEIVAGRLAGELAATHDLVWAASDCDPVPTDLPSAVRFMPMRAWNGIERAWGLPFPIWSPASLARLWRAMSAADAVHLHDFAYTGNMAAFVFAKMRGKPVLITQHVGAIPFTSVVLRGVQRAADAIAGRLILGAADQVVFVSRVVHDYFQAFVRMRTAPLIIANGVDDTVFAPASAEQREAARAALGVDSSTRVLLFVGRFVEKKGLRILERLAARITGATWVFAGWGPLNPRAWAAPNVQVFEDRRGPALVPLYQAADLLVLPSVGEGLPLVVQESLSCGTPVIVGTDTAAAIGAPSEVVAACHVEAAGPVDAWESVINRILDEPGADGRRAAAAAFARRSWSWRACAGDYARAIERLHPAPR